MDADTTTRTKTRAREGSEAKMCGEKMERQPEQIAPAERRVFRRSGREHVQEPRFGGRLSEIGAPPSSSALGLRGRGDRLARAALATNGIAGRLGTFTEGRRCRHT